MTSPAPAPIFPLMAAPVYSHSSSANSSSASSASSAYVDDTLANVFRPLRLSDWTAPPGFGALPGESLSARELKLT